MGVALVLSVGAGNSELESWFASNVGNGGSLTLKGFIMIQECDEQAHTGFTALLIIVGKICCCKVTLET